jgi:hypothetical protein
MTPGVGFTKGALFGGYDLASMTDKNFLIAHQGDLVVIEAISK